MLRLLLSPRWLAATALMVLAFVMCLALGSWQWDRAHRPPRAVSIQDERVVPLPDVLAQPADRPFPAGLLVRGIGRYTDQGFIVSGTNAAGVAGLWAVAPLALAAGGRAVAVVRGEARPRPSAPVTSDVVVSGRLQPPASATPRGGLTAAELNTRGVDPRGYLVLTAQQPPGAGPATLVSSPVPLRSPGLRWQNSVYAAQWWIFAFFAVFAWVRFFREDLYATRYPPGV